MGLKHDANQILHNSTMNWQICVDIKIISLSQPSDAWNLVYLHSLSSMDEIFYESEIVNLNENVR